MKDVHDGQKRDWSFLLIPFFVLELVDVQRIHHMIRGVGIKHTRLASLALSSPCLQHMWVLRLVSINTTTASMHVRAVHALQVVICGHRAVRCVGEVELPSDK